MPTPSKYQLAVLDWLKTGTGNALIEARAGSGKTTLLVQLAQEIDPADSAVFLAFNKSIATELKTRLPEYVEAATFHSVCLRAYTKTTRKRPKVEGSKCLRLYDEITGRDSGRGRGQDRFNSDGEEADNLRGPVLKLVGLAKASAMLPEASVEDWRGIIEHHDIEFETVSDEDRGLQLAREILAANNAELDVIDFDDMLYLCWLKNAPISRYDYVMIDEAQDTNTVQRELLRRMLGNRGRLVAVGDGYQAIYGFRGADSGAMDAIAEEFNCARLPLSISYRCPRSVITAANNALGLGEDVIEPRDNAPEGTVASADAFSYRDFTADDLVVCRNTAPVVTLAYKLLAAKIPAKVLGRDIGRGLVNIIKRMHAHGIDALREKIDAWEAREIEAAMAKRGAEMRAQSIADKAESIRASIDALEENERTVPALIRNIEALFSDNGPRVCTLSTVHKAKGLEASRVFVLDGQLMPSKYAKQDWQKSQERNLIYVAYTRSLDTLLFIDSSRLREVSTANATGVFRMACDSPTGPYIIEIGLYDGAYSVRHAGLSTVQAYALYRAINVGNGYKKRLRLYGRTLARELTGGYVRPRHIRLSPWEAKLMPSLGSYGPVKEAEWTRTRWFIGMRPRPGMGALFWDRVIFPCRYVPTYTTHGAEFAYTTGPYRTKREALKLEGVS